jgi:hypothetical protein
MTCHKIVAKMWQMSLDFVLSLRYTAGSHEGDQMKERVQIDASQGSRRLVRRVARERRIRRPAAADMLIMAGYERLANDLKKQAMNP